MGSAPVNVAATCAAKELVVNLKDPWLYFRLHVLLVDSLNDHVTESAARPQPCACIESEPVHRFPQLFGCRFALETEYRPFSRKTLRRVATRENDTATRVRELEQPGWGHVWRVVSVIPKQAQKARQAPQHAIRRKRNLRRVHENCSLFKSEKGQTRPAQGLSGRIVGLLIKVPDGSVGLLVVSLCAASLPLSSRVRTTQGEWLPPFPPKL